MLDTGSESTVYGTYNPATDEITIYDDRIERDGVDRKAVEVHEQLHRWQFQTIPEMFLLLVALTLLSYLFGVIGVLTLNHLWILNAAALYYFPRAVIEIPVYAATFFRTGSYTFGFLSPFMMLAWFYAIGLAMQTGGAWMLYDPGFVPRRVRPFLGDRWRQKYRGTPEPFLLQEEKNGGTSQRKYHQKGRELGKQIGRRLDATTFTLLKRLTGKEIDLFRPSTGETGE
ncbi:hypothetical protein HT576_08840 [Haloterrigena sp. SYSU A121-1]|uniref:Uncharacterized protein n=1 Tax=Haloterrigena gelatinilytica TaxID=2741724 RepID=A0A8J8GK85_9EURY|nr:hypothetical protein [Haloterrigena gelatinilytica]NUB91126.1 hypothetical protein [Haloterrigena gelatinilytica]